MSEHHSLTAFHDVVGQTRSALVAAAGRRDARLVAFGFGVGYLLAYLATVGDLSVGAGSGPLSVRTIEDLSLAFRSTGFFRFEAIALVQVAGVTYLFSPLNLVVAGTLAALVGANAALSYLGIVQPRACGLEASSGVVANIPALLSGAACCGPTILLVVGIQASASIVAGFRLLIPLALVMLVGSLLLVGRNVEPSLLAD
ncbi:MAG: hypothetical protein ABEH90_04430 [Halolamina sp.]